MESFIKGIPKAELHIHIEGSLEPELMLELAAKNRIDLPFHSVSDIRNAYNFKDLQSFLDIYYQGAQVLRDEEDFYRLTRAYLEKAALQNIRHTEIFFDPQTHTLRGIEFKAVVRGIYRAMMDAREHLDLSSKLILCFLRHLSAAQAMETLEQALPYKDWIVAVGLDSSEQDHPPEKFIPVFNAAREAGFKAVAHAGEEGPPDYIWQALNLLKVKRIDHGVRCQEDPGLVDYLAEKQVPLTVCPLSNVRLKVFDHMRHHNLKQLLSSGLCVTINSDDPAYFGGYVQENFMAVHKALGLSPQEIAQLARNSFLASFLDSAEKKVHLNKIEEYLSLNVA